jgi:hypothetical protein
LRSSRRTSSRSQRSRQVFLARCAVLLIRFVCSHQGWHTVRSINSCNDDAPSAVAPTRAGWLNMNKGLIWTIVGILLIIALVIWIMQRT